MTTHLQLAELALTDRKDQDGPALAQAHALIHIAQSLDRLLDGYGESLRNARPVEAQPFHVRNLGLHFEDVAKARQQLARLSELARGYTRRIGTDVPLEEPRTTDGKAPA